MNGVWIRGLLDPGAAAEIVTSLESASFVDGRLTAQGAARAAKDNRQLSAEDALSRGLGARLVSALTSSDAFRTLAMPRTLVPFTFSRYDPGMSYADHVDLPVMGTSIGPVRTDLSMTVFLSGPTDYDGGELVIESDTSARRTTIKGNPGDAWVYSASHVHRVEPVTRGRRYVALTWVQSLVADPEERELLASFALALSALARDGVAESSLLRLRAVHHRLTRRWVR